jgi:hypothetical protein
VRGYNDRIAEFGRSAPGRSFGLGSAPNPAAGDLKLSLSPSAYFKRQLLRDNVRRVYRIAPVV